MAGRLDTVLEAVRKTGTLDEMGRRDIQRIVYDDGHVSLAEAETLFDIHAAIDTSACPDWAWVLIGAITDILLRQSLPRNRIDASESVWLLRRIQKDGRAADDVALDMVINILKNAESAPDNLERLALSTIEQQIAGNGFVTAEDVERLRQVLHACGSSGGIGICRMEAEYLLRIADMTNGAVNDDSFKDLFVGAMANHLMLAHAPSPVSDEEALRREYWLHERGTIAAGWARAMRSPIKALNTAVAPSHRDETQIGERVVTSAASVPLAEARWLVERLSDGASRTEPEAALVLFLANEAPETYAVLRDAIERAA